MLRHMTGCSMNVLAVMLACAPAEGVCRLLSADLGVGSCAGGEQTRPTIHGQPGLPSISVTPPSAITRALLTVLCACAATAAKQPHWQPATGNTRRRVARLLRNPRHVGAMGPCAAITSVDSTAMQEAQPVWWLW